MDFPSKLSLLISVTSSRHDLHPECKHCVTSYIVNEAIPERGSHGFQMSKQTKRCTDLILL